MSAPSAPTSFPPIVPLEDWQAAQDKHLKLEKALTRMRDAVSAARRRLPMVEVTTPYTFASEDGEVSLLDLFDGKRQLVLQHFMFHPDWDAGCDGCSMMADHIGPLAHLHARDTNFVAVARAPLEKLLAYRDRMEWKLPFYSSFGTSFNEDFGMTVDDEEHHGVSFFVRDGDRVFRTFVIFARGVENLLSTFWLLDSTVFGRQEEWEDSPAGWPQTEPYSWWRRHDEYESAEPAACCGSD